MLNMQKRRGRMKAEQMKDLILKIQHIIGSITTSNNLTKRLDLLDLTSDFAEMARSFNGLIDLMGEIISQIKTTSVDVLKNSTEVSDVNRNLSIRIEQQAKNLAATAVVLS